MRAWHLLSGPIPANAGETQARALLARLPRAYPRERGGNADALVFSYKYMGLSPRTRGKPHRIPRCAAVGGPIPANAGETWYTRRRCQYLRAYPRERGGNSGRPIPTSGSAGLSPRTRGKRSYLDIGAGDRGPIPANAGETSGKAVTGSGTTAYPRERGGNHRHRWLPTARAGLSPRTRGKPDYGQPCGNGRGPIPANAGETSRTAMIPPPARAYPRERGGNHSGPTLTYDGNGLSPRTRGKLHSTTHRLYSPGPIPANAGETIQTRVGDHLEGAYPRERGGNSFAIHHALPVMGLSPRTRGKRQWVVLCD